MCIDHTRVHVFTCGHCKISLLTLESAGDLGSVASTASVGSFRRIQKTFSMVIIMSKIFIKKWAAI